MLLRADNISKHFKGVTAIQRLDFELEEVFQCSDGHAESR
jgi:ABC-type sugar transport system ATPase subunit